MPIGFQLIADRWPTSGAWGTSVFGTAYFGGNDYPITLLPSPQMGSDDLTAEISHYLADVVLKRNGKTVSVRPYADWSTWRVVYAAIPASVVAALWPYCQVRVFNLLPNGDDGVKRRVYWTDGEFRPVQVGRDTFSLSFTLESV